MDSDYYGGCGYSAYGYLIRTQNRENMAVSGKQWEKVTVNICRFWTDEKWSEICNSRLSGIDPNQPFDPEELWAEQTLWYSWNLWGLRKKFHVEEDGIRKQRDLLWTIVSTYTDWKVELTSSIDMELSVREANTKRGSGQKETLPAGTHFVLLKTDGRSICRKQCCWMTDRISWVWAGASFRESGKEELTVFPSVTAFILPYADEDPALHRGFKEGR